jgi:hypothetical protein
MRRALAPASPKLVQVNQYSRAYFSRLDYNIVPH